MMIAVAVIWSGFFVILFSLISTPLLAWWLNKRAKNSANKNEKTPERHASYKVIDAQYEIIERKPD